MSMLQKFRYIITPISLILLSTIINLIYSYTFTGQFVINISVLLVSFVYISIFYGIIFLFLKLLFKNKLFVRSILEILLLGIAIFTFVPYSYSYLPCDKPIIKSKLDGISTNIEVDQFYTVWKSNKEDISIGQHSDLFFISENADSMYFISTSYLMLPSNQCSVKDVYKVDKELIKKYPETDFK